MRGQRKSTRAPVPARGDSRCLLLGLFGDPGLTDVQPHALGPGFPGAGKMHGEPEPPALYPYAAPVDGCIHCSCGQRWYRVGAQQALRATVGRDRCHDGLERWVGYCQRHASQVARSRPFDGAWAGTDARPQAVQLSAEAGCHGTYAEGRDAEPDWSSVYASGTKPSVRRRASDESTRWTRLSVCLSAHRRPPRGCGRRPNKRLTSTVCLKFRQICQQLIGG